MADPSVLDVFREQFRRDGARPFLTWYGDGGARVELSIATLERWVAKTANYLQDGLAAQPGEVAAVALPDHWLAPAIWWACWHNGIEVELIAPGEELPVDADLLFVAAGRAGEAAALAPNVIAVSTAPLGGRIRGELAGGVADFGADVPGYGDRFSAYDPPTASTIALRPAAAPNLTAPNLTGPNLTGAGIVSAAATRWPVADGARVLSFLPLHTVDGLLIVVAALAAGGSIVVGTTDAAAAAAEKVTATAGGSLADIPQL
jgi:uncharacterized protein (TIGR03089 family)